MMQYRNQLKRLTDVTTFVPKILAKMDFSNPYMSFMKHFRSKWMKCTVLRVFTVRVVIKGLTVQCFHQGFTVHCSNQFFIAQCSNQSFYSAVY